MVKMNKRLLVLMMLFLVPITTAVIYESDGGLEPYKAGYVYYHNVTLNDRCLNRTYILEFYDNNGTPDFLKYKCMNSCISTYYYKLDGKEVNTNISQCTATSGGSRGISNYQSDVPEFNVIAAMLAASVGYISYIMIRSKNIA